MVGLAAVIIAIVLGTAALMHTPQPAPRAHPSLQEITVSPSTDTIPLSDSEIFALLGDTRDYGPLSDPQRLASCLNGLDYPTTTPVLGARPIEINGRPGVLLVLPEDRPDTVVALAVAPSCSAINTGLLADTTVVRP
jgi:hypothetical protein